MDNRTIILLLVFSFSLLMLWNAWHEQNKPPESLQTAGTVQTAPPVEKDITIPTTTQDIAQAKPAETPVALPSTDTQAPAVEPVRIETDLYIAEISPQGGDLVNLELKKYKSPEDKNKDLVLFTPRHKYVAQTGLINGQGLPNHKTLFKVVPGPVKLEDGKDTLEFHLEWNNDEGITVVKTYSFHRDSYLIDIRYDITNSTAQPLAPDAYFQFMRDNLPPEGESKMLTTFTGPAVYTSENKYQKVTFANIGSDKADFAKKAQDGWLAMVQHYFVSAWVPEAGVNREYFMRRISPELFSAGIIVPVGQIVPGGKASLKMPLYTGPQEQARLVKVDPALPLVVDYGWLTVIAAPLFWVLGFMYKLVGNWGWAIVGLTILIKLIFFPLSAASYKSMAKMRTVAPRLTQLKELYGNDKPRLQQEMMDLYRKEKINPLGGCLPILIQIPVFIALYWVLLGAVEMRDAHWILWLRDLSSPDPYYVLPVIMMASMFIQFKLNPTPPDPIQAKVMMIMPLVFGVMFFFFPAGLVLYWVVNNILSIAQQWQITRMIEGGGKKAKAA